MTASNAAGQAYALMVMTPIVPGEEGALRGYIEGFTQDASPLARMPRTHFARWVIVPDFVHDPEQPAPDPLACQYLVFTSNFDGPLETYLDDLCDRLELEAREIWGRCAGCERDASPEDLKAYLLHNQVDTGFFVAAYPDASVAEVKEALATRERLIDFAERAQAMEPAVLRRTFDEELAG